MLIELGRNKAFAEFLVVDSDMFGVEVGIGRVVDGHVAVNRRRVDNTNEGREEDER